MKGFLSAISTIFCVSLFGMSAAAVSAGQSSAPRPSTPVEPVSAILEAFRSHNIVALDVGHGNEQAHAFRLALIRDARFPALVNDIVWECGNARYQDVMDKFMRGEPVPDTELRETWRHTVGSIGVGCDLPINEEFPREVRAVNVALPQAQRLRVLLGDPPINWDEVTRVEDALKWTELRDVHAAEVIRLEVLVKNRRALVIYGSAHLARKSVRSNYERDDFGPLVDLLGDLREASVFSIWVDTATDLTKLQATVTSWTAPQLAVFRGSVLGAAGFMEYWGACCGGSTRFTIRNGARTEIPKDQWRSRRMEDQFDALLYLGPPSAMTQAPLSPSVCADDAYMQVRLGRMALVGQPTDGLKKYCASVLAK